MVEICGHLVDYVGGNRELGGNSRSERYVWSVGGLCKLKQLKLWEQLKIVEVEKVELFMKQGKCVVKQLVHCGGGYRGNC